MPKRNEARVAFGKARRDRDKGRMKSAAKAEIIAGRKFNRIGCALEEVVPLVNAREALRKEREAMKAKLAREKEPELLAKTTAAKNRYDELKKIIRG